jgi:AcrR family transcriptional regulator
LLGAAGEILAENGYAKTRSADIARRAGVSRSTFYEQFRDVDDCLLMAYEAAAECVVDLVAAACEMPGTPDERLRRAVASILEFLDDDPALVALFGSEAAAGVPAIAAARERLAARVAGTLFEARAQGGRGEPLEVERSMVAGGLALVSELVSAGEARRLPALAPELAELLACRFETASAG